MGYAYTAYTSNKRKAALDHALRVINVTRKMARSGGYMQLRGYPRARVRPRGRFKPAVDPVARVAAQRHAIQERLQAQTKARNRRAAILLNMMELRRHQHNTNALLFNKLGFVPNYEWQF